MTEAEFKKIIGRHDYAEQTHDSRDQQRSIYWLRTNSGKTVIVSFKNGECSGIDESALGKAVGKVENAMAQKTHTLRIDGDHVKAGIPSGKVKGGFGPYSVSLEHDNWKDKLGRLPHLLVKSGETFEFSNVPVGECIVTATPILVINIGKHQKATLTTALQAWQKTSMKIGTGARTAP